MDHQSWRSRLADTNRVVTSQGRSDLIQDLGGHLSDVISPKESHHSEETLPIVPLGQFQAQRSDDTITNNITHSKTNTPSQSEINSTITENIVTSQTSTPSQREIFSETGTGTSSNENLSHSDGAIPKEHLQCTGTQSEHRETSDSSGTSRTTTSSQSEIFSGYNNIYNNSSDCKTYTSSQSKITTEYDASSEPSSREASRPSSESGNLSERTVYSPTREMAVIYWTISSKTFAVLSLECLLKWRLQRKLKRRSTESNPRVTRTAKTNSMMQSCGRKHSSWRKWMRLEKLLQDRYPKIKPRAQIQLWEDWYMQGNGAYCRREEAGESFNP